MAQSVVSGATLTCTFGVAPATLTVLPMNRVMVEGKPIATIQDFIPLENIVTFGMCSAPTNPAVIAANAPVPCVPAITSPWMQGSPSVAAGGMPVLNSTSQCMCMWLGVITVSQPGEMTVSVS